MYEYFSEFFILRVYEQFFWHQIRWKHYDYWYARLYQMFAHFYEKEGITYTISGQSTQKKSNNSYEICQKVDSLCQNICLFEKSLFFSLLIF